MSEQILLQQPTHELPDPIPGTALVHGPLESIVPINEYVSQYVEDAKYDSLTRALTRHAGERELEELAVNDPGGFFVMFVDLDNFKQANDTLGHSKGDEVLVGVADALDVILKVRGDGKLIRWGGDEFLIIFKSDDQGNDRRRVTDEDEMVEGLENRVRATVKDIAQAAKAPFVGASIGTTKHVHGETALEMVKRADAKMYEDKATKDTRSSR